ncbi:hypothetical protein CLOM_g12204, partial [Closterium sp. NIES-68]
LHGLRHPVALSCIISVQRYFSSTFCPKLFLPFSSRLLFLAMEHIMSIAYARTVCAIPSEGVELARFSDPSLEISSLFYRQFTRSSKGSLPRSF